MSQHIQDQPPSCTHPDVHRHKGWRTWRIILGTRERVFKDRDYGDSSEAAHQTALACLKNYNIEWAAIAGMSRQKLDELKDTLDLDVSSRLSKLALGQALAYAMLLQREGRDYRDATTAGAPAPSAKKPKTKNTPCVMECAAKTSSAASSSGVAASSSSSKPAPVAGSSPTSTFDEMPHCDTRLATHTLVKPKLTPSCCIDLCVSGVVHGGSLITHATHDEVCWALWHHQLLRAMPM